MKTLISLTVLALFVFAVSGCGNPDETTGAPPPPPAGGGAPIKGAKSTGGGMPAPTADG